MADFNTAVTITIRDHEKGFQNNPKDKGNWFNGVNYGTNFGITPATLEKYCPGATTDVNCIRNLQVAKAIEIYRKGWWPDLYDRIDNQAVGNKLFDMGVLMGQAESVKLLQIALTADGVLSVVSDGKFGPVTLAQVNGDPNALPRYRTVLYNHAMNILNNNPTDAEFIGGWITRINS